MNPSSWRFQIDRRIPKRWIFGLLIAFIIYLQISNIFSIQLNGINEDTKHTTAKKLKEIEEFSKSNPILASQSQPAIIESTPISSPIRAPVVPSLLARMNKVAQHHHSLSMATLINETKLEENSPQENPPQENYTGIPEVQLSLPRYGKAEEGEARYPCMDFQEVTRNAGSDKLKGHDDSKELEFEAKMDNLYQLTAQLSKLESELGISFILLHGSLIGHYVSGRTLPWDDDLDVSITEEDSEKLRDYFNTLEYVTNDEELEFYLDNATDYLWYYDPSPGHHIEFRLHSGCNTKNQTVLVARGKDSICPRVYIDITILYDMEKKEAQDLAVVAKLRRHRPSILSDNVMVYKALRLKMGNLAHIYNTNDLFPLKKCLINGVTLSCPHNIEATLLQEYGTGALRSTFRRMKLDDEGCWIAANPKPK